MNVIIGRNNAGKSTLLDVVEAGVRLGSRDIQQGIRRLQFRTKLEPGDLEAAFPRNTSGGHIPGASHWDYAKQFVGRDFEWAVDRPVHQGVQQARPQVLLRPGPIATEAWESVASRLGNPLQARRFYKLAAARDVVPQKSFDPRREGGWQPNGAAVTSLVSAFVNLAELPTEAVTGGLLYEFNRIVSPEEFLEIVPQVNSDGSWELYLAEGPKGRIPLSASGAGYKTLISVLALIDLMPQLDRIDLRSSVFGLEELENNLHPALQRRLFEFIRQRAVNTGATFFLTTHSSVAIDMFQGDECAQIVHVEHDGKHAGVSCVVSKGGYRAVLDDLDVRASDLLQSNGIVWVEGPSDRRYFNRWVELWSQGALREGIHYRCIFYGGKLLSHVTANDEEDERLVALLDVNRNAVVLMDRDRDSLELPVNATKARVSEEVVRAGGIAWTTAGREIENYIPPDVLAQHAGVVTPAQSEFEPFSEIINRGHETAVRLYARSKVAFAEFICPHMTRESLASRLDLGQRLTQVVSEIERWNSTTRRGSAAQLRR